MNRREVALIGTGLVRHQRLRPVRHGFNYPTYFLMLPLRSLRAHGRAGQSAERAWTVWRDSMRTSMAQCTHVICPY